MLDPIAAKGKAVVLNPVKIPDFSNALNSAQHTNDMQMQLYKIAAEQRQKEAALQAARAKAEQDAKDAADKLKAKDQADMMGLFKTKEGSYLVADAPDIARQKVAELTQEYAQLAAKGHTLYDLSPEVSAWHDKTRQYHNWYNQNAEIAKTYSEKSKKFNENPLAVEPYNQADDFVGYNRDLKENKPHYPTSLTPIIEPADRKELASMFPLKFSKREDIDLKSRKMLGSNYVYDKSTEFTPEENAVQDIKSRAEYYFNTPNLSKDQIAKKKLIIEEAAQLGALNQDGSVNTDLFAQKYVQKQTPEAIYDKQTADRDKPRSEGGGNSSSNTWNGGVLNMGRKGKTATLASANTQIDAGGQFTSGWNGFTPPSADFSKFPIVATLSVPNENVIALNQLPENVAFDFSGGVAKPIKSKSFGNGGVKQEKLYVIPSLYDIPLNQAQLEEAKRKGLPIVYKSYQKTTTDVKDENDNKVEKEVLLDVSAISKADFINMQVNSEFGQQTIDELNQRNSTKTQVQTPVVQSQGKKTGTGYNRGSLPPSGK